jgi:hypothetical protein
MEAEGSLVTCCTFASKWWLRDRWSEGVQIIQMESTAHYSKDKITGAADRRSKGLQIASIVHYVDDKITDGDTFIVHYNKRYGMLVSFLISLDDAETHG